MKALSNKIGVVLQPIFIRRNCLEEDLKPKEVKPPVINRHCVVYVFKCYSCDTNYVNYTARHLHQRVTEHNRSSIGQHLQREHGSATSVKDSQFKVLKKCRSKFDCLIYEMLFIQKIKPNLNVQSDSVRAKLFVWHFLSFAFVFLFVVQFSHAWNIFKNVYKLRFASITLTWKWR